MRFLNRCSFHKKIFIGMLTAALIPMLIGYLAMIRVFNYSYESNLAHEAETLLSGVSTSLDSGLDHIREAVFALRQSHDIQSYLMGKYNSEEYLAYRELYAISSAYGDYASFCIYDQDGEPLIALADNKYTRQKLSLNWGILYEAGKDPGSLIIRNGKLFAGTDKEEFLRVALAVQNEKGHIIGYFVAIILDQHMDYMLKGTGMDRLGSVTVSDDFREPVYFSGKDGISRDFELAQSILIDSKERVLEQGEYSYYYLYSSKYRLHIFYRQLIESRRLLKNNLVTIAFISGMFSLLLCLFLSSSFSRVFYKPIKRITEALEQIQAGNLSARVKVYSQDELGQLSQSVNLMSEHLSDNIDRLLERERELSRANIKMMQAQLNPHFIYNTLDTMKWIGKANRLPELATLSSGLAQILRTSISSSDTIPLRRELEIAEAYIEIQKIRFEDRFEFFIDIPEELMDLPVPKLILQPIVENSIIHGFAERDYGEIFISGEADPHTSRLYLYVQDNGCGMNEATLERLNCHDSGNKALHAPAHATASQTEDRSRGSIGFYNVHEIIRLHYGDGFGLHAASQAGYGSKVTFTLPLPDVQEARLPEAADHTREKKIEGESSYV